MIVAQVLGTSSDSSACRREMCGDDGYIAFPIDRMQMDLGTEIVVPVSGVKPGMDSNAFGEEVYNIFVPHFLPFARGVKIGVQVTEARTVREFTKKS